MAITRAQQYKQMLQKGGRIGLKGGADAASKDFGKEKVSRPNPREDRKGGQYTSPEAKAVVASGGGEMVQVWLFHHQILLRTYKLKLIKTI